MTRYTMPGGFHKEVGFGKDLVEVDPKVILLCFSTRCERGIMIAAVDGHKSKHDPVILWPESSG